MKSILTSLAVLTASLSLLGGAYAESNADKADLTCPTQEDSYLSIVGVQGANVQPRMELRELEKHPAMWNLFIQAFARFQAMDQTEKTSYFQIAGMKLPSLFE
jgi:tyrosinase